MSANTKVISVNPCAKTLGEFNFSSEALSAVSRSISSPSFSKKKKNPYKSIVNILLGINSKTSNKYSRNALIYRIIGGITLLILASFGVSPLMLSIIGISMILGLVMRVTAFAGFISFSSIFVTGISIGDISYINAFCAIILGIFSYFGPGRYSTDLFIRKDLFLAMIKSNHNEEPNEADSMDYRAYSKLESYM